MEQSYTRTPQSSLQQRARQVLRTGFGTVTALLILSTVTAYQIQRSMSNEAVEIYHRHVKQDDVHYRLRRSLWLGSGAARDFLLNPFADRLETFASQLRDHRADSRRLLDELKAAQAHNHAYTDLRAKVEDFWSTIEKVPASTEGFDLAARYQFVQREVVPRRNAAGDVLRQFTALSQAALQESELEFAAARRLAASRLLVILGLSLVLAVTVASFSLHHSGRLEKEAIRQHEAVARAKSELQQLSARLMEVQEEERARLSRELHDEIGQALATLRLEINRAQSAAESPVLRERLERARALAERTVGTIRNMSLLLRPAILDDLGLGPALQWQTGDFTQRTGVACEFVEDEVPEELPESVRTCMYRVLQESLHNCEKHADASTVCVSVSLSESWLTLTVEDNGKGFSADVRGVSGWRGGFGILGMQERAHALNGTLSVDSAPAKGTRLTLRLPVSAPMAEEVRA